MLGHERIKCVQLDGYMEYKSHAETRVARACHGACRRVIHGAV